MLEKECFPLEAMDNVKVEQFWRHMSSRVSWAKDFVSKYGYGVQPMYLWGDDAQVNERGEKVMTIGFGHCLDDRKSSVATVWPLFLYRCDPRP